MYVCIRDPDLVRPRHFEVALYEVRDESRWLAGRIMARPVPVQRADFVYPHETRDAMLATCFSGFPEIKKNPGRSINAVTCAERRSNQTQKLSDRGS
jgi:hypothetical protein